MTVRVFPFPGAVDETRVKSLKGKRRGKQLRYKNKVLNKEMRRYVFIVSDVRGTIETCKGRGMEVEPTQSGRKLIDAV